MQYPLKKLAQLPQQHRQQLPLRRQHRLRQQLPLRRQLRLPLPHRLRQQLLLRRQLRLPLRHRLRQLRQQLRPLALRPSAARCPAPSWTSRLSPARL